MFHHIVHPPEILQQQPPVTVAEHIGFVILQPDMDQTVACPAVTEGLAVQDRLEPLPQIFHHLRVRVIRQQTPQQTLHAHGVELLVLLCKAAAQQLKLIARVQSVQLLRQLLGQQLTGLMEGEAVFFQPGDHSSGSAHGSNEQQQCSSAPGHGSSRRKDKRTKCQSDHQCTQKNRE